MRAIWALLGALALGGCMTSPLQTYHANQERAETLAETLYSATWGTLEQLVAQGRLSRSDANGQELLAWRALMDVRTAYNLGLTIDLTALRAKAAVAGVSPAMVNKAP